MEQGVRDFSLDLSAFSASVIRSTDKMFDADGSPLAASLPFADITGFKPSEDVIGEGAPVDPAIIAIPPEYTVVYAYWPSQIFAGEIMVTSENFVVQDIGNNRAKLHRTKDLQAIPEVGAVVRITYANGVGHVKALPTR